MVKIRLSVIEVFRYFLIDMKSLSAARPLLTLGIRHKILSSYKVKAWEDPWKLTTLARLSRPNVPVVHLRMPVLI